MGKGPHWTGALFVIRKWRPEGCGVPDDQLADFFGETSGICRRENPGELVNCRGNANANCNAKDIWDAWDSSEQVQGRRPELVRVVDTQALMEADLS
jgi:hypothetical protein